MVKTQTKTQDQTKTQSRQHLQDGSGGGIGGWNGRSPGADEAAWPRRRYRHGYQAAGWYWVWLAEPIINLFPDCHAMAAG